MPDLSFEWDPDKAHVNLKKHGVTFEEARTVFFDASSFTIKDEAHSSAWEERLITIGRSEKGQILIVASCERGDSIRLISARKATRSERICYEQEI